MLLYPHTSLLRPRFRCWTTCWTLRWRTACWEEGPRTTRTTPSTSTMKNSKPKLRWGAEDWVVVWGDVCKFDLAVCCSAGHWQVCQGGWYYYAVCQEHTRCHAQYLHTGSARSEQHGSVVPFFFFSLCEYLLTFSSHFLIFQPLDLQNMPRGGAPALSSFRRAAQPAAAVARLSHHQLCGYNVSGSPHRPARGSSGEFPKRWRPSVFFSVLLSIQPFCFCCFPPDGLHVWQRCVLCRHGVQECKLLPHLPVRTCGAPAAGWGCPRQHVSHITMKNVSKCTHLNKRTLGWFLLQAWT